MWHVDFFHILGPFPYLFCTVQQVIVASLFLRTSILLTVMNGFNLLFVFFFFNVFSLPFVGHLLEQAISFCCRRFIL